ncbi:hypothetical protein ANCCAN_17790 [Ancylostoma caninum]|uniref:Uncharacterized protein n=1 Tax=Ancylostoma caninum TaxID=29170 RepID=A0A368FVU8_ANCCA|nr:hypothetical protein ANCCAN_17790 [Ancylostoma caninum]
MRGRHFGIRFWSQKGNHTLKGIKIQQYSLLSKERRPDKDWCPFQLWKNRAGEFLLVGTVYSNKCGERLSGKHARFLLKAHVNKDVGRECKSWSASDIKRYSKNDIAVDEIDDEFTSTPEENSRTSQGLVMVGHQIVV